MTYKSVLAIWDGKETTRASLKKAISIVSEADGHLHILCPSYVSILHVQPYPYATFPLEIRVEEYAQAELDAGQLSKEVEEILASEQIFFSVETAVIDRSQTAQMLAHVAKFSDLVILPRPFGHERAKTDETLTEAALIAAECPILIVPSDEMPNRDPKAVIAWDGSNQSLRAIRAAFPLLHQESQIDVVVITDSKRTIEEAEISSDIATFLARHDLNVTLNVIAKTTPTIAAIIRNHATDIGADLIVMGGYGHSPLRELFFGGPTRDMLQECKIPVLMAH